nr:trimethylguanosine synthase [Hymenolepis microstoma]
MYTCSTLHSALCTIKTEQLDAINLISNFPHRVNTDHFLLLSRRVNNFKTPVSMYSMQHVIEIVDIEYPSPLNGVSSHIILSRAFFKDPFCKYKRDKLSPKTSSSHHWQSPASLTGTVSLNAEEGDLESLPSTAPDALSLCHILSPEDQLASYGLPSSFGRQNNRQRGSSNRGRARIRRPPIQELAGQRHGIRNSPDTLSSYFLMRGLSLPRSIRHRLSCPSVLNSTNRSNTTEISANLAQRSNSHEVCGALKEAKQRYKKLPKLRKSDFKRKPECKTSLIPWKLQRRLCASRILPPGNSDSKRTEISKCLSSCFKPILKHFHATAYDIAIIRDLAEPCESYLRAHSLPDLRLGLPETSIARQYNNDDNSYSQMVYKYSVICKLLKIPFSLRHSHCHFPKCMRFYLPTTWQCTDIDDLRMAIFNSLNSHTYFDYFINIDNARMKCFPYIPPELIGHDLRNVDLEKYWRQRYRLFSLFDEGIHIDREGLFSVTPEVLAIHHARRLLRLTPEKESPVALDLFTGVGGNCIQLALAGFKVVTVDFSKRMIEMARMNAEVYGVADNIEFICSDAFKFLRENRDRYDAILASPPWGGPEYSQDTFSLANAKISDQLNIFHLVEAIALKIRSGGPVAIYLPRNTNAAQLFDLHQRFIAADPLDVAPCMECEMDVINYKAKAMTVYLHFGENAGDAGEDSTFEPTPIKEAPKEILKYLQDLKRTELSACYTFGKRVIREEDENMSPQ